MSRDTKSLYVSNRLEGSISVIDFATRSVVAKWVIPGGGSPNPLPTFSCDPSLVTCDTSNN